MGKSERSAITMCTFHSYVCLPEGKWKVKKIKRKNNTGWWFQSTWKIWKSLGMISPNTWKNKSHVPVTTNQNNLMASDGWDGPVSLESLLHSPVTGCLRSTSVEESSVVHLSSHLWASSHMLTCNESSWRWFFFPQCMAYELWGSIEMGSHLSRGHHFPCWVDSSTRDLGELIGSTWLISITLWQSNIATENGHRNWNSEFSQ